jgi:hypothetical protein
VALGLSAYISRALNLARDITRRIFRNDALVSADTTGRRRERRIVTCSLKAWKSREMLSFSNEIPHCAAAIFSQKVLRSAIQDDRMPLSTRQVFLRAERCAFGIHARFV